MKRQASERQVEYITVLAEKLGWPYTRVHVLASKNGIKFSAGYHSLNIEEASKLINLLVEQLNVGK